MKNIIKISMFLFLTGSPLLAQGQSFELSKTRTTITIRGTSSLHDWTMDLNIFNSYFQLNHEGSSINNIENVTFTCKATDIKSERTLMDIKAYNALKAKEYPDIKFFGLSTTRLILNGNKFTGDLIGKLSVAGETNDITVPFTGTFIDSTTINISASTNIALSSFNITPPTALRGALNTGDKISVSFNLEFIRKTL